MDIQKSILTYFYDLLTGDTKLKTAMGGTVRLYPVWAVSDAPFPYLVHRSQNNASQPYMISQATYYLDIWSYQKNADEILAIRQVIMELLDELEFSTEEIDGARLWIQTDGFIPESTADVWHYALQFNLRYFRTDEVASIVGR